MFQMFWLAFVLFALAGISDFFDGLLAKKYNAATKIGGVLDHIGDKLLVINTMVMLAAMMPIWFVVAPIIVMISREIYISGLREFLGTQKIAMPVPKARFSMAKIKTSLQMIATGAFLLMFAVGISFVPNATSRLVMFAVYVLPKIGIWGLWLALAASMWSAATYTMDFAKKYKKIAK
jgi:CDP-diacylglycerol--glycerol-3-phosphate 3-phosphatidyltransferase